MAPEAQYPRPPQHDTALKRAREKCPEAVDRIDEILNQTDAQLFGNLTLYEPPQFPGVKLPITKVAFSLTPEEEHASPRSIIEVNTSGFEKARSPLAPENYYDRVFTYAERAKQEGRTIDLTILFVGQATALGGKTTKEFYRAEKQKGLAVEGQIVATLAEKMLPDDPDAKENTLVHFYGKSMGAIKAHEASWEFKPTDIKKQAELITPPRIPGLSEEYQPTDTQIILGYALQGSINKKIKRVWQEITRREYTQELKAAYEAQGISIEDNLGQRLLKRKMVLLNVKNILNNKIHERKDFPFPVDVRAGALDPINVSIRGYQHCKENEIIHEGNLTVIFAMDTHTPDKYPVKAWSRAIKGVDIRPL